MNTTIILLLFFPRLCFCDEFLKTIYFTFFFISWAYLLIEAFKMYKLQVSDSTREKSDLATDNIKIEDKRLFL